MTQSTCPSSSQGSDATQYTPNTDMNMGQLPWPQPAYIPHPDFYYPYGVPPNAMQGAAPPYAPVAPSAPPLYHQGIPLSSFPGATNNYAPSIPHQAYLHQHHGPGLATGSASSSVPQSLSAGQKRVAEDLEERDVKRTKIGSGGIKNDPLFTPVLDQHGQPDGTFVCSKDGMILRPGSYLKHLNTKKHLGFKLNKFKCPGCPQTYTRRDACKRHWDDGCGKLAPEGSRLSYLAACQGSGMSSASVAPVTAPTTAFTFSYPYPVIATSMSWNVQITPPAACVVQSCGTPSVADLLLCLSQSPENDVVTEPAKDDDDDPDFWEANEIRDVHEM
ncbi:hypothetical protein EV702DRAFT_720401 [Suillus placidus]|uniref:Uncharacterized protein n=1 Tax=Suillus placidus TaxID=48579 RepID=A0A9P6ZJ44_9AGAM|nr:hypothetical protein EV702DRAFT_720401 [Suillus placidus]